MDRIIKKRQWFANKTCDFCKKQAKVFRVYKDNVSILCDRRECNKKWMDKMGMFNQIELKLK